MASKQNLSNENIETTKEKKLTVAAKTAATRTTSATKTTGTGTAKPATTRTTAAAKTTGTGTAKSATTRTTTAAKATGTVSAKPAATGTTTAAKTTGTVSAKPAVARTTAAAKTAGTGTAKPAATRTTTAAKTTGTVSAKPATTRTTTAAKTAGTVPAKPVTTRTTVAAKPEISAEKVSMEKTTPVEENVNDVPSMAEEKTGNSNNQNNKKKFNKTYIFLSAIIILLMILTGGIILGGKSKKNETSAVINSSVKLSETEDAKARENTLKLAERYIQKGLYDQALGLLNALVIKDADDEEAQKLLDRAAELKKRQETQSENGTEANDDQLAQILREQQEENRRLQEESRRQQEENSRVINDLIKQQQEQAKAEAELRRQREEAEAEKNRIAQEKKAEEEKKAKEEAARKAALDEQRRKLEKEIDENIISGNSLLKSGKVEEAISYYDKAKNVLPENDNAYQAKKLSEMAINLYNASETLNSPGKEQAGTAALHYANLTIAKDPADVDSHFILGMDLMNSKDYAKAEVELEKAVKKGNNAYYYYQLGRAQAQLKKYNNAQQSLTTSVTLDGTFAKAHFNLGFVNEKLGKNSQALASYKKAYGNDPDYENAYIAAARILVKQKDYNGAIVVYNEALKNGNKNQNQTYRELGSTYVTVGDYKRAEECFRKVLAYSDADLQTIYNLSTVLSYQNKMNEAKDYAEKAYSMKDGAGESLKISIIYNYALICQETNDFDNALKLYKEVIAIDEFHVKANTNLGAMCLELEDADSAIRFLTSAYRKDKNNFELNNNIGNAYKLRTDYDNAIVYYKNALNIDPKHEKVIGVQENLAKAYSSKGDYAEAKTIYEDVIKKNNENWSLYIELAKVCISLKENENAEKYLLWLQSKNPSFRTEEVNSLLKSVRGQ